jgi:hypothetical protein
VFRLLAALVLPVVVSLAALTVTAEAAGPAGTSAPAGHRAGGHAEQGADLEVTLDTMAPAVLPARRPVVLRGRVTNRSDETWTGINVYPCTSSDPITTESELQAAVESDPELVVCRRSSLFVPIGDLEAGETRTYTLRVPRDELGIPEDVEGVFWLNVHALGASPAGRDVVSDGRARTFISNVDRGRDPVRTSVLLPIRQPVHRDRTGRLADPDQWAADLATGGRLSNVLQLAQSDEGIGAPLLVDPAVVDAVRQLARGNPSRGLGPVDEGATGNDAPARAARAWLERFQSAARNRTVLALPYGDIDLAAVGTHGPSVYELARRQSQQSLGELGIRSTPAMVPPTGLLNMGGLAMADDETVVVLSEKILPEPYASDDTPPATIEWDDHRIGLYDPGVSLGGPGPDNPLAALAVRQRVLAQSALRALNDDDRPVLVNLPPDVDPGPFTDGFFSSLDQRFVDLRETPVEAELDLPAIDEPAYPEVEAEKELEEANVDRVEEAVRTAAVLDDVLVETDGLATRTTRDLLSLLSYAQRADPFFADSSTEALAAWMRGALESVSIEAPPFVILSSDAGPFPVTVSNGLDQPVQLRLRAHTDGEVEIRAPEVLTLPPGASQTFNLQARAGSIGVHNATLVATDTEGRPIGATEDLNVRSNQVGAVIWVVMGVGVGILFLAIGIRLVRRVRRPASA